MASLIHRKQQDGNPTTPQYKLSEFTKLVAQLYAVIHPLDFRYRDIADILKAGGYKVDRRVIQYHDIARSVDELVDAELGDIDTYSDSFHINLSLVIPLIKQAHKEDVIPSLLYGLNRIYIWDFRLQQKNAVNLRINLIVGKKFKQYWDAFDEDEPEFWGFLAAAFDKAIYQSAPEDVRSSMARGCLRSISSESLPAEPIIDVIRQDSDEIRRESAGEIALIRVFQGRFDDALQHFEDLPARAKNDKDIAVSRESIRGLIQLLRGNEVQAIEHIEKALKLERGDSKKKIAVPQNQAFVLSLLALVKADSAENFELLNQIIRAHNRERSVPTHIEDTMEFVRSASRANRHGSVPEDHWSEKPDGVALLSYCLAHTWLGQEPEDWAEVFSYGIIMHMFRARKFGYAWKVAECKEILNRFMKKRDYRRLVEDLPGEMSHEALGTQSLSLLVTKSPPWELKLKSLEQLAFDAQKTQPGKKKESTGQGQRRIAWEIDSQEGVIIGMPRQQTQQKNGRWGKGRKISASQFKKNAAQWDFLLPQDREVAGLVEKDVPYYVPSNATAFDEALAALAGHPYVFNTSGESVEVVLKQPEISVEKRGAGYHVSLAPDENYKYYSPRSYVSKMVTPSRLEVTHFTPLHLHLMDIVPKEGLDLPDKIQRRLIEAIAGLSSKTRVQSSETGDIVVGTPVDADPHPWVLLEPYESGLSVAIVVEPIENSDIYYEAGVGGVTVFANLDGQSFQTKRDLDAERANLNLLLERCPALLTSAIPTERERLVIPELLGCLELLQSLDTAQARCKWPKGEKISLVSSVATTSLRLSIKSADEWLKASGNLNMDQDRSLDLKLLLDLMDKSTIDHFVELEPGQFLALSRTFKRQLEALRSLTVRTSKGELQIHRAATPILEDLFEETEFECDDAFRDLQKRISEAQTIEPEVPSTLTAELRPYQINGFQWLARLANWGAGACLADDMGLGKTVQALALLLTRATHGAALVVAPTSVVANWAAEARKFAPTLNVKLCIGSAASRLSLLEDPKPFDLFVTTYGLLVQDVEPISKIHWNSVIMDEAQAIKNANTKRARAAKQLIADFRLVTTGTPIQNNIMDLHSLFSFLNPGLLGSTQRFQENFGNVMDPQEHEANLRLRRLVTPFLLRRLKSQVLDDLPERTEITHHVTLSEDEASFYEAIRLRAVEQLESASMAEALQESKGTARFQILAQLMRLRLACCHPRLVREGETLIDSEFGTSSKLEAFAEIVEELIANNHKVLVFSQFVKFLRLVEDTLKRLNVSYQYLDGSTPNKARQQRIDAFQSGEGDVFLISLKAGGTGLNLTAADYVIHLDPWWNPAVEDQASDRAHRIGQTRPVTIYRLVAEGTIEEQIVDLHHHKRDLANRLLEDADSAAKLSADELLELIRTPLQLTSNAA